jgi:hypothetical protein
MVDDGCIDVKNLDEAIKRFLKLDFFRSIRHPPFPSRERATCNVFIYGVTDVSDMAQNILFHKIGKN